MTQLRSDTAPPGYYDEGYAPVETATPKGRVREYVPASALNKGRDAAPSPSAHSCSSRSSRKLLPSHGPPRSPSSRFNAKYLSPPPAPVPTPTLHPGSLALVPCPAGLHDFSFSRRKSALLVGLCVASPAIGIVATICARNNIRCTRCGVRRADEGLAQYGHVEYGAISPPSTPSPPQQQVERKKMALAPGPVVVVAAPARGRACGGRKPRQW